MNLQVLKNVLCWHMLTRSRKPLRSSLCRNLTSKFLYHKKPLKQHSLAFLNRETSSIKLNLCRLFSTGNKHNTTQDDDEDNRRKMPQLMDSGAPVIWPSVFQTLKSMFISTIIIKPYFDPEFTIKDFVEGAKQAISFVSSHLSSGKWVALEGLVTPEALVEIKSNYVNLNLAERQSLEIKKEHMNFTFLHQIGIILNDDSSERFAEILVVCHVYGLQNQNSHTSQDFNINEEKISVCNYRFRREFTKGIDSSWMINQLNHYRATDLKP